MVARTQTMQPALRRTTTSPRTKNRFTRQQKKQTVRFGAVEVRNYNRTIGDQPCCYGPPLALAFEYTAAKRFSSVAEYEKNRGARSKAHAYPLTPDQRFLVLKQWGVSEKQIRATVTEIEDMQEERTSSNIVSPCYKLEQKLMKMGLIKESANKLVTQAMTSTTETKLPVKPVKRPPQLAPHVVMKPVVQKIAAAKQPVVQKIAAAKRPVVRTIAAAKRPVARQIASAQKRPLLKNFMPNRRRAAVDDEFAC